MRGGTGRESDSEVRRATIHVVRLQCVYLFLIRLKSLTRDECSGIFRMSSQSFSAHTHTHTHTHTLTHSHTLSRCLTHTHTLSLSLSYTYSHSHHPPTHTHTQSHTVYTHIHHKSSHDNHTVWVAHDTKYSIQLVVMIGATRLHVLLTTVKDRFKGQKFSKYTPNGPNIYKKVIR